jgi:hypothetical protein
MKKILQIIMSTIVSFNMITTPVFGSTASSVTTEERTIDKINTFLSSGAPSDIPFIDYMEDFAYDSSQPLKRIDLSGYEGKRLFLGYGVYDKEQNFCKYVEKPGMEDPSLYFENITTFNKHSYAISMTTMNYDTCKQLANDFNGKPVMITSAAENGFVSGKYGGKSKWIGMARNSCLEPYYSEDGKKQEYFNWSSVSETANSCEDNKMFAVQNQYGTWNKSHDLNLHHCLIEVDTEDINRPIKICAPWWRIEREYANEAETTFYGVDVYKINQADIPEQFSVCTKFEEEALTEALDAPDRQVTCTSYYDATVAPECLQNPYQDICHVDECNGYIKNACRLTGTVSPFKDYTKAEEVINGAKTITKGKVDIKTHVYDCPPSLPSVDNCLEQSSVLIFPKECPSSDCEGYKECVQNAESIEDKTACGDSFVCEKIYGNPDNVEYNADGSIKVLKNTCSDGTVLEFEPSIQSSSSKKCLEYEYYTIEEEVSQKCILDRPYSDYQVDTSLTEEDVYMNNPNCLRLNNILDARPTVQVMFKYTNFGMAQTVVKKTYLDGDENIGLQEGSDADLVDAAMNAVNPFDDYDLAEPETVQDAAAGYDCSAFTQSWYQKTNNVLNETYTLNRNGNDYSYIAEYIGQETNGDLYAKYIDVLDAAMCDSLSSEIGGTSINYQTISKICKVYIPKTSGDQFSLLEGMGSYDSVEKEYPNYNMITKDAVNEDECKEIAYCFDGSYNQSAFVSSATSQCKISWGDSYSFPEISNIEAIDYTAPAGKDENCKPLVTEGSYLSQLDGTQDIFSVQEVVTGDWGYYSNYNSHSIQNNVVTVNDKEVYPIIPIPIIDDPLVYEGDITQTSIMTTEPNIVAGFLSGGVVSVAMSSMTGVIIGPVTFIIVSILFAKKQKYNEQSFHWIIYKLVPHQRYISNVYGYDHRVLKLNDDGSVYVTGDNKVKLIYAEFEGNTGTLKPADFKTMLNNLYTQKTSLLTCMGWFKSDVENITHSAERGVVVGYPKCKKWAWSCDKKNKEKFNHNRDPFFKRMANSYIGAVNGVSIVVPYLGDYEVQALDQYDNVLGEITITEEEFRETTADMSKYAQVMFGLNMDLANGIDEGLQDNACRYDLMVEWGGGVSGIYYENNDTGQNQDCQKSHDSYVRTNSATKLKIKSTTSDRYHVIDLAKPLPFANRVFLVTLNEKEIREYRCFEEFGDCDTDSFNTEE